MQIISEFIWEKNSRPINEDSLCLCHVLFNGHPLVLAAICDGVGGIPDGESASSFVISCLKSVFNSLPRSHPITLSYLSHVFKRCLFSCHEELSKGATTVCLALIYKKKCLIMSYGDSRIYYGSRKLHPVTKDHTDSFGHLTQAIGIGDYMKPFCKSIHLKKSSALLLCSDGFYRRNDIPLRHKNIFYHCNNEETLKEQLSAMYCNAVNQGEKDNCSAIAFCFKQ